MKVGDKIKMTRDGIDLTEGKVYDVVQVTPDQSYAVRDDVGDLNWLLYEGNHIVLTKDYDELAELRAFKERALARFPALAEPETDDEAIIRFVNSYHNGDFGTVRSLARDVLTWARTNPR